MDIKINGKRRESPEINIYMYGQLMYARGARSIQWGKYSFFNKWCWVNWTDPCKKKKKKFHYYFVL